MSELTIDAEELLFDAERGRAAIGRSRKLLCELGAGADRAEHRDVAAAWGDLGVLGGRKRRLMGVSNEIFFRFA